MKRIAILLLVQLTGIVAFTQPKASQEPLVIQGQLLHCPEDYLFFVFEEEERSVIDTIHLDKDGRFYLKTYHLKTPQQASIQRHNIQINGLFVAPGYNLTITGNATNFRSLLASKQIAGKGAASNRFRLLQDSLFIARNDSISWYDKNEKDLLDYVAYNKALKDSLAAAVFSKQSRDDQYLSYFGRMVRLDNLFENLYYLMAHADINGYGYEKTLALVNNHFDTGILRDLYRPEYMLSYYYKTWLMGAEYLSYHARLDKMKDSAVAKKKNYNLEKVYNTYQGPIKELILFKQLRNSISSCKTFEQLKTFNNNMAVYLAVLEKPAYKQQIDARLAERTAEIMRTQVGQPAPPFTLENNEGKVYSLSDFKGKVVYIDLWASWCSPCRAETPALKALYNKYKSNDQIAFISIAVSDGMSAWKKALADDQPGWLQLLDKENTVSQAYVANMIPQFVLIDKQGNISSNSAPFPSDSTKIEKLLEQELAQ